MRLIARHFPLCDPSAAPLVSAYIYRDADWQEFIVKPRRNSRALPAATWYHTDDLPDANATAKRMLVEMLAQAN